MMAKGNSSGAGTQVSDREPTEIEALLPFHAAGTLGLHDTRRVDAALANDADLARQYKAIQDEYAETILLNESLGAPSVRAMQRLSAAIDAEPVRRASAISNLVFRLGGFFSTLSARTLALSAIVGAAALLLQAGVIGGLVKARLGDGFETASFQAQTSAGTFGLLRFAPNANIDEISQLLITYDATIISGPKAGMFRIKFGQKVLSKEDAAQLLARLQNEKIVNLAVAAE